MNETKITNREEAELWFTVLNQNGEAKTHYCSKCRETGKRYDATKLGYSTSFTEGGEEYSYGCKGCYWNDTKEFNRITSNNYKK